MLELLLLLAVIAFLLGIAVPHYLNAREHEQVAHARTALVPLCCVCQDMVGKHSLLVPDDFAKWRKFPCRLRLSDLALATEECGCRPSPSADPLSSWRLRHARVTRAPLPDEKLNFQVHLLTGAAYSRPEVEVR